jgi:hypothetical protein
MESMKKILMIDPVRVGNAKATYGPRSEEETVAAAVREVLIRDQIDKAFRRHGKVLAGIDEVFSDDAGQNSADS